MVITRAAIIINMYGIPVSSVITNKNNKLD